MNIEISDAKIEDLEDILTLQKIAYESEADIHDDYSIPPLHQTMNDITNEFQSHIFLKVIDQNKIVGSVRANEKNGTCYIGKLIVNPAYHNRGIGTKLLTEIEKRFKDIKRFELFTGYKSKKNLYIYYKIGYKEFRRENISDKLTLIFLEKIHKD